MKLRHAMAGIVWIGIGVLVHVFCTVTKTPLVIHGTTIPWSYGVMVTGVIIALLGMYRGRKEL
jgi:hypothetical protein